MKRFNNPPKVEWDEILKRPMFDVSQLTASVSQILADIRQNGIQAIQKYTEKFDGVFIQNFTVSESEFTEAASSLNPELKSAIEVAANNIFKFHQVQMPETKRVETMPGVVCWQKPVAIEKVGLYIPGG